MGIGVTIVNKTIRKSLTEKVTFPSEYEERGHDLYGDLGKSVLNRGTACTGTQVSGTSEEPNAEACEWVQREGGKVRAELPYCRSTVTSVLRKTNTPA